MQPCTVHVRTVPKCLPGCLQLHQLYMSTPALCTWHPHSTTPPRGLVVPSRSFKPHQKPPPQAPSPTEATVAAAAGRSGSSSSQMHVGDAVAAGVVEADHLSRVLWMRAVGLLHQVRGPTGVGH